MGRRYPGAAEAVLLGVSDDVTETLDTHVFTEDEDPTDRYDKFEFDVRIRVHTRHEYEWLKRAAEGNISFVIESYD